MDQHAPTTPVQTEPLRLLTIMLGLVLLLIPAVRIAGFSDLYDNAQPGPIAHMIDITENGQWLMQREPSGEQATKPPLYPWIGALCIKTIGLTDEWVFKLPIMLSYLVATWLVYDLGRRAMGSPWGLVAAAFWAANYHVFKLAYTARTDMLLTMWIIMGVWAVQVQREHWAKDDSAGRGERLGVIAIFWLSIGLGLLTKGPPVLLAVGWLLIAVAWDKAWKRFGVGWQLVGVIGALTIGAMWLFPTLEAHPEWKDNIRREVVDRVSGEGSGSHRHTPALAVPAYYFARFAPWAILTVVAAFTYRRWQDGRNVGWTFAWILFVIGVFMIPKGKRADYILPAYAGGAVLAAAVVRAASKEQGGLARVIGVVLGGTAIVTIGVPIYMLWKTGMPQALTLAPMDAAIEPTAARATIIISGLVALVGSGLALAWSDPPQYAVKSLAVALAVVGTLGVYQNTLSRAARSRAGDYIQRVADEALELHRAHPTLPLVFHDVGKTPVQALMNNNDMESADKMTQTQHGAVLVTSLRAWQADRDGLEGRSQLLLQTPELPESGTTMMLLLVEAH